MNNQTDGPSNANNATIPHTFLDHAQTPFLPDDGEPKYRGGITSHFPILLHAMLTKAEAGGYSDICSWATHGRAFFVHDRDRFVKNVLPLYFQQKHFASFQRQLNLYGFDRVSHQSVNDPGAYYHPMFLRTRQDLCRAIQRCYSDQNSQAFSSEGESRDAKRAKAIAIYDPNFSNFAAMPQSSLADIQLADSVIIPQRRRKYGPEPTDNLNTYSSENDVSDGQKYSKETHNCINNESKAMSGEKKNCEGMTKTPLNNDSKATLDSEETKPPSSISGLCHDRKTKPTAQLHKRKLSDPSAFERMSCRGRKNDDEARDLFHNWSINRIQSNASRDWMDLFTCRGPTEGTEPSSFNDSKNKKIPSSVIPVQKMEFTISEPIPASNPFWNIQSQQSLLTGPTLLGSEASRHQENERNQFHEKLQLLQPFSGTYKNEGESDDSAMEPRPIAPGLLPLRPFWQQEHTIPTLETNPSRQFQAPFHQREQAVSASLLQQNQNLNFPSSLVDHHTNKSSFENQKTSQEKLESTQFKLLMDQISSRHRQALESQSSSVDGDDKNGD